MYKDIGRSFCIPNGVDKDLFYPREKDLNYLIFASAPNRGLGKLPFLLDCIKTRVDRPLYLRAYSNLEILHPNEKTTSKDVWRDLYESYNEVEASQVELRDPIPQDELAVEIGKAGLMVIPTEYPEICSNLILQALASGTPVLTTGKIGSQGEWVNRSNGRLTKWLPHDYMIYVMDFVRNAVEVLENEKLHRKLMRGATRSKVYTWDEIGAQWWKMIRKLS
jgi:glycosyltransferase involved in cell wall biosynthesis